MNSKMKIVSQPLAGCEAITIKPFGEPTQEEKDKGIEKPYVHAYKYPDKTVEFSWKGSDTFRYTPSAEDVRLFSEAMAALLLEIRKPVRLLKEYAYQHYDEKTLKNCILV